MYKTNSRPSGSNSRFSSTKRGGFRKSSHSRGTQFNKRKVGGKNSRFSRSYRGGNKNRRGNPKASKLDVSSFINTAIDKKIVKEKFIPK